MTGSSTSGSSSSCIRHQHALRAAVSEKYEKSEDRARGGVTYTYLVLCEMFEMSREVKAFMLDFI